MHTKETLQNDLKAMGIAPTDTVLLHTSMKKIGQVQGGADAVLDALQGYLAPGLLVLPALNWHILDKTPLVYDMNGTPSIVGILTELFRKRPDVHRSLNPTHSVCAYGKDAEEFVRGGDADGTPLGPHSPWRKLVARDAWISMVGCDLTSCTFIHGVEEWYGIPNYLTELKEFDVTLADGSHRTIPSRGHAGAPSRYYWKVQEGLERTGLLRMLPFGDAPTMVLRARELFSFVSGALSREPQLFSHTAESSPGEPA